ncbi:glycoside hydrolase superfamily [Irpex rosettiformis]|uniref:Glycoside hydrolase superfamily n=1 Tax=Irpex rosettiformis TaxID=378272 RepID=A0ACB8UGU3_9APHY|nr:glycoside hydrolase superfamily [Irpex rosettiformis]
MRPRFIGRALQDESYGPRQSYASSGNSVPIGDDAQSSVYGLNPNGSQTRDTAYYSLNYRDDPHDSDFAGQSTPDLTGYGKISSPYLSEKRAAYAAPRQRSRKRALIIGGLVLVAVIIVAVVVAVYFTVGKSHKGSGSASGGVSHGDGSGETTKTGSTLIVTGGDGSKVTKDDGSTFIYSNSYGGIWYWDPSDPFNNGARPQSWSPALNETFNYGIDSIRGVNLGGWLNTEPVSFPFSDAPALYEKYLNGPIVAIDEFTLSQAMAADTAGGGLKQLEDHYATFITEEDFAQIAAAGLNYVRIPLPYWAIEVRQNEPFLANTCWKYFLKAIQWARKYGIRINLDLHALPGSQNGWNHSSKFGTINVLNGPMGLANAQRALDYIRILAEFISQPEYQNVVTMFGVTNEPLTPTFGQENLARYYLQAYNIVRKASGIGEGNGPMISFHEGFAGLSAWNGYYTNSDRVSYDIHPYVCFNGQSTDGYDTRATQPCTSWGANQNQSMASNGLTAAGEFSNAINDCGLYVNGVNLGTRYEGNYTGGPWPRQGSCEPWTDWQSWTPAMKKDIMNFALASMDALQHWFFWTWKIGNSSVTGKVESPAWSYQLGLQEGWMPKDPRKASGTCGNSSPWTPPLKSWQTGGAGADQIPASFSSSFAWPPTVISNVGAATLVPTYTQTGPIPTLPGPTFTSAAATVSVGSGWQNSADNKGLAVAIPTCSYLDPWVGTTDPPSPLCSGSSSKRDDKRKVFEAVITPAPTATAARRFKRDSS